LISAAEHRLLVERSQVGDVCLMAGIGAKRST
jgi:hypothetical protein